MSLSLPVIGPERKWTLLGVALVGKALLTLFLFHQHGTPWSGPWYVLGGDSMTYIDPAESVVRGEGYGSNYRMPGYALIYLLLRVFLSVENTLNALVIVQSIADVISVVLVADIGWRTTRSLLVHQLTFWITLIAVYVTNCNTFILTESLTTFALTAGLHQFVVNVQDRKPHHLLVAGTLLAWAGFMRPAYLPLIPIACIALLFIRGIPFRRSLFKATLLALPITLIDGLWIVRNLSVNGEFRTTTGSLLTPEFTSGIKYPVMRMMQAFGCNYVWWDADATIRWFNIREDGPRVTRVADRMAPIPSRVFTKDYNLDSLWIIRDDVARWYAASDSMEKAGLRNRVAERCDRYIASFAREKPFHYHVVSRLSLLRIFVIDSGTEGLMSRPMGLLAWWEKAIKVFYSALYLGAMLLGITGAIVALRGRHFAGALRFVPIAFLYGILAFPFLVRMCENRYLVVVYPLAVLFTACLANELLLRLRSGKAIRP